MTEERAPALVVVDRRRFVMKLVFSAKLVTAPWGLTIREYPVTVGAVGHATRAGEYRVVSKSVKPDWRAPSDATGFDQDGQSIAGRTFSYDDPINPLLGGFISIEDNDLDNDNEGQGFHAVKFDPWLKLRGRHSHGCVRMSEQDFKRIYDRVLVGTLVLVY